MHLPFTQKKETLKIYSEGTTFDNMKIHMHKVSDCVTAKYWKLLTYPK